MDIRKEMPRDQNALVELFRTTFSAAEGEDEGDTIAAFVTSLLCDTAPGDIHVFTGSQNGAQICSAIFTRLTYSDDPRQVFILSPMAVLPDWQGQGFGQAILRHALKALGDVGIDVAITYGDPAFYGQVGFEPLTEAMAAPPLPLSQPQGWIGLSLRGEPLTPLKGRCSCVPALNNPSLW